MEELRNASDFEKVEAGCVLTIGNFDGVHLGHQELVRTTRTLADRRNKPCVLMAFDRHPLAVLHPEKAPARLTPESLKRDLLAAMGLDFRLVLSATPETLSLPPETFIRRFITEPMRPSAIVEGEDFRFGAGRAGDIDTLRATGRTHGFEVIVVPARRIEIPNGETMRVSSTMIRYMIASGNVGDAALALGRPYRLIGTTCTGRGVGTKLGYPTLNMEKPDQLVPAEGVYAGYVQLGGAEEQVAAVDDRIRAVFSIGQARTFGDEYPLLIEAHVLVDSDRDLAGSWMAMDFVEFLRRQHKFTSPQELSKQIARDCARARELLEPGR